MKPFEIKELKNQNALQSLLKTKHKENALIEVNNILAKTKLQEISPSLIEKIKNKYNIQFIGNTYKLLCGILEKYISYELEMSNIDGIDLFNFNRLAEILQINNEDLEKIVNIHAKNKFSIEVIRIINNGKNIEDNQGELDKIQTILNITDEVFKEVVDKERYDLVNDIFQKALSDGRYSPEEEKNFIELSKKLKVDIHHDEETLKLLEKERLLWKIENDNLPIIDPDILLQKSESCHYTTNVDYYEYKKVTTRIGYSGPYFRVKITKGFYYKLGNFDIQRKTEDILIKVDSGNIYLTNKRIIFIGATKSLNIILKRIIDLELFSDGVRIIKDAGKNIFLAYKNEKDLLGIVLNRILSDFNKM